jgi:hypothetical protein
MCILPSAGKQFLGLSPLKCISTRFEELKKKIDGCEKPCYIMLG